MRLNDLVQNNNSIALSRLVHEAQNTPVIGSNYFDHPGLVVANVTQNPQAITAHLVQSHFFTHNRVASEDLVRLLGIWNEVVNTTNRGDALEVSETTIKQVAQKLSLNVIEHAGHFGSVSGKLIFLATYVGRGIETALLRSQLGTVNLTPLPITANVTIELTQIIPGNEDDSGEELTNQLLDKINDAIDEFCAEQELRINVETLTAKAPGLEVEFEKAA